MAKPKIDLLLIPYSETLTIELFCDNPKRLIEAVEKIEGVCGVSKFGTTHLMIDVIDPRYDMSEIIAEIKEVYHANYG